MNEAATRQLSVMKMHQELEILMAEESVPQPQYEEFSEIALNVIEPALVQFGNMWEPSLGIFDISRGWMPGTETPVRESIEIRGSGDGKATLIFEPAGGSTLTVKTSVFHPFRSEVTEIIDFSEISRKTVQTRLIALGKIVS